MGTYTATQKCDDICHVRVETFRFPILEWNLLWSKVRESCHGHIEEFYHLSLKELRCWHRQGITLVHVQNTRILEPHIQFFSVEENELRFEHIAYGCWGKISAKDLEVRPRHCFQAFRGVFHDQHSRKPSISQEIC